MNNAKPNIILITIDCGRQDMIYGPDVETPHIDKIRESGITFLEAFSQSSTTIPSFYSLFTSRYVSSHGVNTLNPNKYKSLGQDSLPVICGRNGWKVGSFLGFDLLGQTMGRDIENCIAGMRKEPISPKKNWKKKLKNKLKRKINFFSPFVPLRVQTKVVSRRNFRSKIKAEILVDRMIAWLSKLQNERFFAWIHFFDAHLLYDAPPYWVNKYYQQPKVPSSYSVYRQLKDQGVWFTEIPMGPILKREKDINLYPSLYKAALSHIDHQIGRILEWLKIKQEMDNTIIIVTSDHGENLLDNGVYCTHYKLFDETTKVPLILKDPSFAHGKEVSLMAQHIDLMPTLFESLSLIAPSQVQGKSMWPAIRNNDPVNSLAFSEHVHFYQRTLRTVDWQYLWSDPDKSEPWGLKFEGGILLDRRKNDKKDYASFHPDVCQEMEEMIQKLSNGVQSSEDMNGEMSQEIIERLAALGYVDTQDLENQ